MPDYDSDVVAMWRRDVTAFAATGLSRPWELVDGSAHTNDPYTTRSWATFRHPGTGQTCTASLRREAFPTSELRSDEMRRQVRAGTLVSTRNHATFMARVWLRDDGAGVYYVTDLDAPASTMGMRRGSIEDAQEACDAVLATEHARDERCMQWRQA